MRRYETLAKERRRKLLKLSEKFGIKPNARSSVASLRTSRSSEQTKASTVAELPNEKRTHSIPKHTKAKENENCIKEQHDSRFENDKSFETKKIEKESPNLKPEIKNTS